MFISYISSDVFSSGVMLFTAKLILLAVRSLLAFLLCKSEFSFNSVFLHVGNSPVYMEK